MRKPRALRRGDRVALIAPASGFARGEFDAGLAELSSLGFSVTYEDSVFDRSAYTAGTPEVRAGALRRAWLDPGIAAIVAVRGGYGSVQLLPLLDPADFAQTAKPLIGYSDVTSLLVWLTLKCGVVSFHGPMVEGRFARGADGYDRSSFERTLMQTGPVGRIGTGQVTVVRPGRAAGLLIGGTMTQLAGSLGTPYAFDPPEGCVLFLDEVAERPYRIDRLYTQLKLAGIIGRAGALVFNELPRCEEPSGAPPIRDVVTDLTRDFRGPVLFGLPSGHTPGASLTLPFGLTARIDTADAPALFIDESAVHA